MGQHVTEILTKIRGGYALSKLNEQFAKVIEGVRESGKPGEITLTIKVTQDKDDAGIIKLKPVIKSKIPERELNEGIFFCDDDGTLSREDPKQLQMELERKQEREDAIAKANAANLERLGRGN